MEARSRRSSVVSRGSGAIFMLAVVLIKQSATAFGSGAGDTSEKMRVAYVKPLRFFKANGGLDGFGPDLFRTVQCDRLPSAFFHRVLH